MESGYLILMASLCKEPLPGFMIMRPSVGFMNPPMQLWPSSSSSRAAVIVARLLPLMTLWSPYVECSVIAEDRSRARAMASEAKREALGMGELAAAAASEGGADSSSTADPPLEERPRVARMGWPSFFVGKRLS